jgi:4a-hydroxytetrahydrobiopterin dehydratase
MSETITPRRFHEIDWRVVRNDACGHFRTGSFAAGVALVDAIGGLADAADHHPDVDLRSDSVTVRLRTDDGTLGEREVALARQISAAARGLGVPVDPSSLQIVQIAIDALVIPDVLPFWRAVLGYRQIDDEDVIDPLFQGPPIWFQQMDAPRPNGTASTSTSIFRTTKRRRASRPRSPLVATSSTTSMRRAGGRSPTRRATRSTSQPGRTATEPIPRAVGSTPRAGQALLGGRRIYP